MNCRETRFNHTEVSDARISSGYAANEPVQSIASALGVSRNTIIGRARRLGLNDAANLALAHRRPERRAKQATYRAGWWADPSKADRQAHVLKRMKEGRDQKRANHHSSPEWVEA